MTFIMVLSIRLLNLLFAKLLQLRVRDPDERVL